MAKLVARAPIAMATRNVCARPSIHASRPCRRCRPCRPSLLLRALGDKPEGDAPRPDVTSDQPDFWESESFEFLGQISSFALPIFVVPALAVGFFAASTYNKYVMVSNFLSPFDSPTRSLAHSLTRSLALRAALCSFASDADVFLDSPRSDADSAKLYKFE